MLTITDIHSPSFIVYNSTERVNHNGHSLDFSWIQEKKVSYTCSEPINENDSNKDNNNNNYKTHTHTHTYIYIYKTIRT